MEEFKRKLASIRKIASIEPIEGADNIELVKIDGWQCITKKGEFTPGNFCVYFEIDSFLPIRPEFEFLRKSSYKKMGDKEGFRLRTIRLRGQLSQGLAMPIVSFKEENRAYWAVRVQRIMATQEFDCFDVTESLGIEKYDPPIPAQLAGVCKGNFPSFIRKTDQERIQNLWHKIKDCDEDFEVTIKLDGSSCTYYLNDGVFGVCSRNMELKESEGNTFWNVARKNNVEEALRSYGKNIALQGEVIGEGIQGNPEKLKGHEFYLFDIWDIGKQEYLNPAERAVLWSMNFKDKGICWCPYTDEYRIFSVKLSDFENINELLEYANGKSLNSDIREGIVFKSMDSKLSFKVISNQYLLEKD
jgi:RNA ligase (TIGR02306 family)